MRASDEIVAAGCRINVALPLATERRIDAAAANSVACPKQIPHDESASRLSI
jgi:hypothetical protein